MKLPVLFALSAILGFAPVHVASAQSAPSAQATSGVKTPSPKWTEADRQELLMKAQRGDRSAQMWLGAAYEQGWFGERNFQEALKWFRRAAAQDDPDAQVSLGQMYEDGEGVAQNYRVAAKWYRKAAEHVPNLGGAGAGRDSLGLLYLQGFGVPKDYVQAYMWFRLANNDAILSYAKSQMSAEQILEAERMATEWKSRHPEP